MRNSPDVYRFLNDPINVFIAGTVLALIVLLLLTGECTLFFPFLLFLCLAGYLRKMTKAKPRKQ